MALLEVNIYKLEEGIFYAELLCEMNGKEVRIDSRTSDAVALAIRFRCPIYTTETILQKAGIILESDEVSSPVHGSSNEGTPVAGEATFGKYSSDELEELLKQAITNEDYEKASVIRDEIRHRKKK
jgi:bifunctional DNase/RNase